MFLLSLGVFVSGCGGGQRVEDSDRYIKASVQEVVDEWMLARNGTIEASGGGLFYYDSEETSAVDVASTDIRYDLPGEHCFLLDEDYESAYIFLSVATSVVEAPGTDLDAEVVKVADFWRSQGWGEIGRGGEGIGERRIFVYTSLGTRLTYAVAMTDGRVMKILQMESLCAREFDNLSASYLGDFEDRFLPSPSPSSVENISADSEE